MEGSHLAFLQGGWGVANESERLPALAVGVFPRCQCNSYVQDVQAPPASGLGEVLEDVWEKLSAAGGSAGAQLRRGFPELGRRTVAGESASRVLSMSLENPQGTNYSRAQEPNVCTCPSRGSSCFPVDTKWGQT